MTITEAELSASKITEQVKFDAEKTREKWLDGLTEGERIWADQGLLLEGNQTEQSSISITGLNGEGIVIKAEGLKVGKNTLMVPSTPEAQEAHGRTRPGVKRNY